MKKYFFIYKITCLLNGKFYIGQHTTTDLNDGYMGSGKIIKSSIKKHGKSNHLFEILEFLPDRNSLRLREQELVNESLIADINCMNLQVGGGGGFSSDTHASKARSSGGSNSISKVRNIHFYKLKNDRDYHSKWKKSQSESHMGNRNGFFGKKHSQETIDNMKESRKNNGVGEKNSQYGTCWVCHTEFGTKKIKLFELQSYENEGWCRGRNGSLCQARTDI